MSKKSFHWFPFYCDKFIGGTIHFTAEEMGAYLLLLIHQWDKGFIPDDGDKISEITRVNFANLNKVLKKFRKTKKGFSNDFLEVVRREQKEISINRSKSGKLGGEASAKKRKQMLEFATAPLQQIQAIKEEESKEDKKREDEKKVNETHANKFWQTPSQKENALRVLMRNKLRFDDENLQHLIRCFLEEINAKGDEKNYKDFCSHFISWIGTKAPKFSLKPQQERANFSRT